MKASWQRTRRGAIVALGTSLLIAACAADGGVEESIGTQDIINGTEVNPEGTGHVRLPTCSGHLLNNEWLLTAKHCLPQSTARIGSQQKNVVATIPHPTLDVALLRVESPFVAAAATRGFNPQFFQGTRGDLSGKWVQCTGYGANTASNQGGGTLRTARLKATTQGASSTEMTIEENSDGQTPFHGDSGAACAYTSTSRLECTNGCIVGVIRGGFCNKDSTGKCVDPDDAVMLFAGAFTPWLRNAFVPDGLFVQMQGDAGIYLMQGGARFPIPSWDEYVALRDTFGYSDGDVRQADPGVVGAYPTAPRDGSFLRARDADAVYVIAGGAKFWIPHPGELQALQDEWGHPYSNVQLVPSGGLAQVGGVPANGTFLRERTADAVYLIVNGGKYWVHDPQELAQLTAQYRKTPSHVAVVPPGALAQFPDRSSP